jgi:putative endonuclease
MLNSRQLFGKTGESIAVKRLTALGYIILEKNFRAKPGEIDIIAKDKETIVFVEVKARRTKSFGNAKYAITPGKQRKISMAALTYLKQKNMMKNKARFDVVIIHSNSNDRTVEIVKNAFDLTYR